VAYFNILSQHSTTGTEEYHKILRRDSLPWPILMYYTNVRLLGLKNNTKSPVKMTDKPTETRTWYLAN